MLLAAEAEPARDDEEVPHTLAAELPERVRLVVTVPDWVGACEAGTVVRGDTLIVRLLDPQEEAVMLLAAEAEPMRVTDTEPVRVTVTEEVGHKELSREVVGVIDRVGVIVLRTVITVRVTDIVTVTEGATENVCVIETV